MSTHSEKAAARFDDWSATYGEDRISSWFRFYQTLAISNLNLAQQESFLDVGCGTGWAVREASKQLKSGKACGIDVSPKMIAKAVAQTPSSGNIEFRIASSEAIPYPDESFSAVLCTCSFHHYKNPIRALKEIRRVMKRDGKLALLDSARDVSLAIWLQDRWRRFFERSHVRYYTTSEMKSLLENAEFNLTKEITTFKRFLDHKKTFTGLMLVECTKARQRVR
jgi:ubiquinone/menaquinone biosynthesis C-methylase UbiE